MLRYLTLHEVADRVGITYNTAKGYLRKGVLPQADASIGPPVRLLPPETVDAWMETRPGRGRRVHQGTPPQLEFAWVLDQKTSEGFGVSPMSL